MLRLLLLTATVLLAAPPSGLRAAEPFQIAVIIPLTGPGAFLGKSEQTSLGVAEDVINKSGGIKGQPVHFAIADDQSSAQVAVQLLNGVLVKNPPIVLGSTLAALCAAMAPLVKSGPVMWCFSTAYHPPDDGWVFIGGEPASDNIISSARFARERGWLRVALLASTDASGLDEEHAVDRAIAASKSAGQSIVAREHFNPTDLSVAAQVARIGAANPQVIYALTSGTAFGTILHGLSESGLDVPVITVSANETYAQMKLYGPILPKELYFGAAPTWTPDALPNGAAKRAVATFFSTFRARGIEPDAGTLQGWEAAFVVTSAFKKLGTNATAAQVRDYLDNMRGFVGANGPYDFRTYPKHGIGPDWTIVQRWDPTSNSFVSASKLGGSTR
jgi:branched-chain amino acid transport system substrate-binding protein